MNKREFLKKSLAASALLFLNPFEALSLGAIKPNGKKMLMLGGRDFMGPRIVETFLQNGYEVTLLNRGITNPHLFKELPIILCDREKENKKDIKRVAKEHKDKHWDVVVDTWQKSPKAVADFLDEFKGRFDHYNYISTISAYDKWDNKFIKEDEPLNPLPKFPTSIAEEHRYAIRKTLAEEAIRERISNYTIYRSHGMKDYRSVDPNNIAEEPFWPIRFHQGGEILLPKVEDHHMQLTDVKSLTDFIVHCYKNKTYGEFNVACRPTLFKDYVSSLIHATQEPEKLHWVDGDFLIENGLTPYRVIPLWRDRPAGAYYFDVQKAVEAGFVHRPLVDMLKDQLAGYLHRHPKDDIKFGEMVNGEMTKCYSQAKEKEIIEKWNAR